jgi:hypothetical protein
MPASPQTGDFVRVRTRQWLVEGERSVGEGLPLSGSPVRTMTPMARGSGTRTAGDLRGRHAALPANHLGRRSAIQDHLFDRRAGAAVKALAVGTCVVDPQLKGNQ